MHAACDAVGVWLDKFQCVVVGPGLGRDPLVLDTLAAVRGIITTTHG